MPTQRLASIDPNSCNAQLRLDAATLTLRVAEGYWVVHAPVSFYLVVNYGGRTILFCFVFLLFVFAGPGAWRLDGLLTRRT
jgi:putative oxidoreductase